MEWKNIYRGFLMGVSDLIPGVSGGTIALLLGIYERLIASINGLLSKNWKKQLSFLIPLGIGMSTAILSLSRLIEWLFHHYPQPLHFLFLGLILGVLPNLFYQSDARNTFKTKHLILLILATIIIGGMDFFIPNEKVIIQDRSLATYVLFLSSGFIASTAMILPGISGSLVLMIIGVYYTVINAITNLHLDVIVTVGIGVVLGILLMSKVIDFLLKNNRTATFAVIIGMVIGSIFVVYEGFPEETSQIILSVVTFTIGLVGAYFLGEFKAK